MADKLKTKYLAELKRRQIVSRVYRKYQLDGLEIADLLDDRRHKALYIKLAKEGDPARLRELAAEIADNKRIANKGAYFMSCLKPKKKIDSNGIKNSNHRR